MDGETPKDPASASVDAMLQPSEMLNKLMSDATAAYRDAVTQAAGDNAALAAYTHAVAQGLEDFRTAWLHHVKKCLWIATSGSQELMKTRDVNDAAGLHRRILLDGINGAIEYNLQMLRISTRLAEDATASVTTPPGPTPGKHE